MDSDLKKISNTSFTIFVNKGKILTDIFYVINMKKKKRTFDTREENEIL